MHRISAAAARWAPTLVAAAAVGAVGAVGSSTAAGVAHADALSKSEARLFRLTSKRQLTPDTAEYTFAFPPGHGMDRLGLAPASCLTTAAEIEGETVRRPYTPTSPSGRIGSMSLVVKSYPEGKISKHFAKLEPGALVPFKGPYQKFEYKPNEKKYLGMIAGGSGITPMLQIITAILENPRDNTEVRLIFANRTPEDIILKSTLDALAWKHANFKVLYTVDKGGEEWDGCSGFVSRDMVRSLLPPPTDETKILVCGPPGMMKAVSGGKGKKGAQGDLGGLLAHMGYDKSQVYKF